MADGVGKIFLHQPQQVRVRLDHVDPALIVADGLIVHPATAGAEHQHLGQTCQVMGQRVGRHVEVGEAVRPAFPDIDRAGELAIGEDAELRRQRRREQAETGA